MSLQRIGNWGGGFHVSSSDSLITDGEYYGFTVLEDTTITTMSGGDINRMPSPAVSFLTSTLPGVNISGKTLKAGTLVTVGLNLVIKNFKVGTGSVMLHKEK